MEKKQEIIRIIKKYRDAKYLNKAADEILMLFSVSGRSELFDLLNWMKNEPIYNIDDVNEILDDYKYYKSNCRVFVCEYYNHTGRIRGECEIKARNIEEAMTHFKFFYPKKLLVGIY